ncbi:MAG: hypothetical protein JO134_21185 [Xanthobacteraceae bacterium]|nr:hypothetical protein [Xanthobacteraceae bacterium]
MKGDRHGAVGANMRSGAQILRFDDHLEKSANLLNLIAGFYDHGTRVMSGAEQMAEADRQRRK